jgi:NADPH-dependent 2,4-dienoyl-CoA reductase/sulfur reductase-like enzyme
VVETDLIVIGAGPAGMAAAVEAKALGLGVLVLDENAVPGGQIYRNVEAVARRGGEVWDLLGDSYQHGLGLATAFRDSEIDYRSGATVWQVNTDGTLAFSCDGAAKTMRAKRIIVATGAMERAVPIPGWTLPGVMGAGAAQTLLKSAAAIPDGKIVLAGSGPLLLLVAQQLIDAGADVSAVLETTRKSNYIAAAPYFPAALRAASDLKRGVAMRRVIRRQGVRVLNGIRSLRAEGEACLSSVRYETGGASESLDANTLLLHEGVVPNVQITRQMRCEHEWYGPQRYWRPVLDRWGATSVDCLAVAGDGGGIFGAKSAAAAGRLAALDSAFRLGTLNENQRDEKARPWVSEKSRNNSIRPLLDRLFAPPAWIVNPPDDETIICRCEEVSAGEIRECVALGAMGPNQMKAFARCGMGPCQGRMCGLSVVETIAAARGLTPEETGYYRIRAPIKPLTLGELAALEP